MSVLESLELLQQQSQEQQATHDHFEALYNEQQAPENVHNLPQAEHAQHSEHHIELKDNHACGADCPEHSGHEHDHDTHTIALKSPEHACDTDCPEHGHALHTHNEQPTSSEKLHHGHHIEHKAHSCGADCPEHNHDDHHKVHTPHETKENTHEHHIEHKNHACGADCPEHNHSQHDEHQASQPAYQELIEHQHVTAERKAKETNTADAQAINDQIMTKYAETIKHETQTEQSTDKLAAESQAKIASKVPMRPATTKARIDKLRAAEDSARGNDSGTAEVAMTVPTLETSLRATPETETYTPLSSGPDASVAIEAPPIFHGMSEVETVCTLGQEAVATNTTELKEQVITAPEISFELPVPVESATTKVTRKTDDSLASVANSIFESADQDPEPEPLQSVGIATITLPLPEVVKTAAEASFLKAPSTQMHATETLIDHEIRHSTPVSETLDMLTTAIVDRYQDLETSLPVAAPRRARELQKALARLQESQASRSEAAQFETAKQNILQLLHVLGFENPAETLDIYLDQYGQEFLEELLRRLFEIINQGQTGEAIRQQASAQQTTPKQTVGSFVLSLLQLYFPHQESTRV